MKGVVHVHSTYSDGELTLAELRAAYVAHGYRFCCLTDHAEFLDADKVRAYEAECARLSDASFLFVPGLEYECPERMHILGLGTTTLHATRVPEDVIDAIERESGLSIVAHPRTQDFERIEALARLATGIEAWNSKYDGRYAPRTETFALARRLRERDAGVRALYGQDLHFRRQYMGLHLELADATLDRAGIIAALRAGRYVAVNGNVRLGPDGTLAPELAARFDQLHQRTRRMRRLAGSTKALLDALGLTLPPRLKTQLRRLF
jgi:hypothetical protein